MVKFIKNIVKFLAMCIGYKDADAVDMGLVDYSGQGRDKYGK